MALIRLCFQEGWESVKEQEIEKRKKAMEERREEYMDNFISTLEADDFQKVIIEQYLESYFEKKIEIYQGNYEVDKARTDAVKVLDETHFSDIEELISEGDMKKIRAFCKGDFDEKKAEKERKKKKKKN
jgi:hypothetical protein